MRGDRVSAPGGHLALYSTTLGMKSVSLRHLLHLQILSQRALSVTGDGTQPYDSFRVTFFKPPCWKAQKMVSYFLRPSLRRESCMLYNKTE